MIQLEFDFGFPRSIGDIVKVKDDNEYTGEYEIIKVIPEEMHYLPYGVCLPNPEMYVCKHLPFELYLEDTILIGREVDCKNQ